MVSFAETCLFSAMEGEAKFWISLYLEFTGALQGVAHQVEGIHGHQPSERVWGNVPDVVVSDVQTSQCRKTVEHAGCEDAELVVVEVEALDADQTVEYILVRKNS